MTNKTVALVPLRGGSKGIPGKNTKLIAGKPLCEWVLKAAMEVALIDEVWVSTDCPEISRVVRNLSPLIRVHDRPAQLATDTASTESVMLDFASCVQFENLVTIQATSPLLESQHLLEALGCFERQSFDSLLSGVIQKRFFWDVDGTPLNYSPINRPRRQDWKGTLVENGAFYVTRKPILEKFNCRLGGKIGTYEMPISTYHEIDDVEDWLVVESLLSSHANRDLESRLAKVSLLMVDVDGTLTDGGMYYDSNGEVMKRFNTRDAAGMAMVRAMGVFVIIVTREESKIAQARAQKLGLPCIVGAVDKVKVLRDLLKKYDVMPQEAAVIGDDVFDIEALQLAGVSACPKDAVRSVYELCNLKLNASGGFGAVRELTDRIVDARHKLIE